MRLLSVALAGHPYDIHIGPKLLDRLAEFVQPLRPSRLLIVTDARVGPFYAARARSTAHP